jgi:hypothetical protein
MSYKGLVIGGHLAGEWRSHDLPTFSARRPAGGVVDLPCGRLWWDGDPVLETWVHTSAEPYGEFWVPEGKDATWAMMELIRCYREHGRSILYRAPQAAPAWQED